MSDEPWRQTTYRHHDALKRKLGESEARDFWYRCELTSPCDFCGSAPSQPCKTHRGEGVEVPYVHRSRANAAGDYTRRQVWDLTNADIVEDEERRAAEREAMERMRPPRIKLFPTTDDYDGIIRELRALRVAVVELTRVVVSDDSEGGS